MYRVWSVLGPYTRTVEEETDSGHLLPLTFAECVHKLLQLCGALDFEEHFIVVIRNLDVKVLDGGRLAGGSGVEIAFGGHICRRVDGELGCV